MHSLVRRLTVSLLLAGVLAFGGTSVAADSTVETGSLEDRLEGHLTPDQWATLCFLEELGWRVVEDRKVKTVEWRGGLPCQRADLAAAHAAGDLTIRFPPGATAGEIRRFAPMLERLADSIPSRCAYKLKIVDATKVATQKLADNAETGGYDFPYIFGLTFPVFQCKPPRPEWLEIEPGKLWRARSSSANAIESFYTRSSVAECYVAQWVAAWAIQYELYGAEWFDKAFRKEDVAIGTSRAIRTTRFGHFMKVEIDHPYTALVIPTEDQDVDLYKILGDRGYQSYAGLSGIIKSEILAFNAFENFIIVSVSPTAAETLRTQGGFRYIKRQAEKIWALEEQRTKLFVSNRMKARLQKQIDELFEDPVFSEFVLYIHPYGVHTLAEAAKTKLEKGSTPITVGLYPNGREDAFFRHYRDQWRARCLAERRAVPQPPAARVEGGR